MPNSFRALDFYKFNRMKSTTVVTDWFDNTVKRDAENTQKNLEKKLQQEAKLASIELL
jgi:hypothetical protein